MLGGARPALSLLSKGNTNHKAKTCCVLHTALCINPDLKGYKATSFLFFVTTEAHRQEVTGYNPTAQQKSLLPSERGKKTNARSRLVFRTSPVVAILMDLFTLFVVTAGKYYVVTLCWGKRMYMFYSLD